MSVKIAFFDAKPYDVESFNKANENFGFEIKYFKGHLNSDNVLLSKGADVACIFVNAVDRKSVV